MEFIVDSIFYFWAVEIWCRLLAVFEYFFGVYDIITPILH